ncbi:MAG TPA: hypothetical protein VHY20_06935, partial [Pirellulales bacterium]|nr:hypothetical protein [Pirellulales bacterium]
MSHPQRSSSRRQSATRIGSGPARHATDLASLPLDFVFRREPTAPVDLTFVLLDWSCRESYHFLDYLNDQTAPRDSYEIIWVEYYARRAA